MTKDIKTIADFEEKFEELNGLINEAGTSFSDLDKKAESQIDLDQVDVVVDESEYERINTEKDLDNTLNAMILDMEI